MAPVSNSQSDIARGANSSSGRRATLGGGSQRGLSETQNGLSYALS